MQIANLASGLWQGNPTGINANTPVNASWQLSGMDVTTNLTTSYKNCKGHSSYLKQFLYSLY